MLAREPDKPDPPSANGPPPSPPSPPAPPPRTPLDEETIAKLRAAARKRRPWGLAMWLIFLAFLALPVGLVAWMLWPRAEVPPLVVTAFDDAVPQGEPASARGQLEAAEPGRSDIPLGGHEVTFEWRPLAVVADRPPPVLRAMTGADGVATARWDFPAVEPFHFVARYLQADGLTDSFDRARVFPYPKEAKLLVVDVAALAANGAAILQSEGVPDAGFLSEAAPALRAAQTQGLTVVYLATGLRRGTAYRHLRNWVESQVVQPNGIPDGPVLGRLSAGADPDALAALRVFIGPASVIVCENSRAGPYRAAGVRTLVLAPGGLGWKDVGKELTK